MSFDVVVAADRALGIAKDGDLPWHLPGEMAHFESLTSTTTSSSKLNAVIMGRKTWESIPDRFRPLPKRINVVLTRQESLEFPEGVLSATSLPGALALLGDVGRVFVIGGGAVYEQAVVLPECRNIYFTRIQSTFDCDTFFPEVSDRFQCQSVLKHAEENGLRYRIELWTRNEC